MDDWGLVPEDDMYHPPQSDEPWWTETVWFSWMVPERNLLGYWYTVFRANIGVNFGGVLVFDEKTIIVSAHQRDTAREVFAKIVDILEEHPNLNARVESYGKALNREYIRFKTGQTIRFKARSAGGGRGFSCDCLLLDEAQILSSAAWAAILPTMSARPNPQAWLLGTPPTENDDGEVFAIPDFELYVVRSQGTRVALDFGTVPALLVPAPVLRLNESQQVFILARALADVARGLHPLSKFKAQDLMLILAAAARSANPNYGSTLADGGALNELNRRIVKALSRKDRRAFEDVAAAYASAPPIDFGAWVHDNIFAANRVASLITGDLGMAVEVLRQEDPALVYLEGEDLVTTSEVIADLLRYWCSDASMELRRRMAGQRTG